MGIKITEYANEQTSFNNNDEFDVSAYVSPGNYQSRKYFWSDLVTALTSVIDGLPSGTQGYTLAYNGSAWTSNNRIFVDFTNSLVVFNNNIDVKGTAGDYSEEVAKFGDLRVKSQKIWFQTQFALAGYTTGFEVVNHGATSPETQDCYLRIKINNVPIRLHGTIES
jgi:hypothetical protein